MRWAGHVKRTPAGKLGKTAEIKTIKDTEEGKATAELKELGRRDMNR